MQQQIKNRVRYEAATTQREKTQLLSLALEEETHAMSSPLRILSAS